MEDDFLTIVLRARGPMLSSQLARILVSEVGLSEDAARKRVQRGGKGITKLNHIIFPHRSRFVYLSEQYGSRKFFLALNKTLQDSGSIYFYALQALAMRDNLMPKEHFKIACGAPISQKKHVSAESVIERLIKSTIVNEVHIEGFGDYIVRCDELSYFPDDRTYALMRGRLLSERIALLAIKSWARNLGIVSYDKVETREDDNNKIPKVGTFNWDLAAPSYLFPMRQYKGNRVAPGFFVCDICLNSQVTKDQLSAFVKKCTTLRNLTKVGSCLQVFVATSYDSEGFSLLKSEGIIPATPDSLFGEEVAEVLISVSKLFINTANLMTSHESIDRIFNSLSRVEGAASTLRGCLFEFMVAQIANNYYPGYEQEMNRIVSDSLGRKAEIDVLAVSKKHEIVFIECKGMSPLTNVDDSEVEKWINERIPVINSFIKTHSEWSRLPYRFELWTSGKITEQAKALIDNKNTETSKYTINFLDGDELLKLVHESNDSGLIKSYKQHFINHPLKEERKIQKRTLQKKIRDEARCLNIESEL
ncbi:hypothetical protein NRZ31_16825 [Aeromonas dhakensis]|uniref:hypothetical protein n=1 Tax=Aeromonas dhakensis TaxID=196024 RepID=UPI00227C201B|nr:hypothetical protein [Aeromonas dhakensis]WAF98057.1 hypothetical protein NRZ31_16825 [Aeromonas dhakensis]